MKLEKIANSILQSAFSNFKTQNTAIKISTYKPVNAIKISHKHYNTLKIGGLSKGTLREIEKVKNLLLEGQDEIFQNKKEARIFQEKLIEIFENANFPNNYANKIVELLNNTENLIPKEKFTFIDSKNYKILKQFSANLYEFGKNIEDDIYKAYAGTFEHLEKKTEIIGTIHDETYSYRTKSQDGVLKKLIRKFNSNELKDMNPRTLNNAIGDLFGERLQMRNLDPEKSKFIIESLQDGNGELFFKDFEDFKKELDLYFKGKSTKTNKIIDALEVLKVEQNIETYHKILAGIKDGTLNIVDIANYGDEITSYFTSRQLDRIIKTIIAVKKQKLKGINPNLTKEKILKFTFKKDFPKKNFKIKIPVPTTVPNPNFDPTKGDIQGSGKIYKSFKFKEKGAVKSTGYSSFHLNFKKYFTNGQNASSELQIRGREINELSEIEHKTYDCSRGKIAINDEKLGTLVEKISKLTKKETQGYNKYLTQFYRWKRLKELGIETQKPILENYVQNIDKIFSIESLAKID